MKSIGEPPKSYRVMWIIAVVALAVVGFSAMDVFMKLSNDDCTTITTNLGNGSTKTTRACS